MIITSSTMFVITPILLSELKPAISYLVNEQKGLSMCRTGGASLLLREGGDMGALLKIFQNLVHFENMN